MVGIAIGSFVSRGSVPFVSADEDHRQNSGDSKVDQETLKELYQVVFGRPLDKDS